MLNNYLGQLMQSYPEKAEMLEWMKYALDNRVYYFGEHFKAPFEARPLMVQLKSKLQLLAQRYKTVSLSYDDAVICNAYFNVAEYIKKEGYKTMLPPWQTGSLTKGSKDTIYDMMYADFNIVISDAFLQRVYKLRDELKTFFQIHRTPFLLLSNDLLPIHRMAIDVCKELNISTGVFLHGLPGRYNSIDDSRADYLFVWGEKIRENYLQAGCNANVVVTGHPNFSSFKMKKEEGENVVVLSRAINGAPSSSNYHRVDERGICIQHIFAVESALKEAGYKKAVLRLHPSENPEWYAKFMDKDFYRLDSNPLGYTIGHAKLVTGFISTVMLDTVLNDIPCYPFVIDKDDNPYAGEIVPPFNNKDQFPTANTITELADNIINGHSVTKKHFDGYISPLFDVKQITQYINK